MYTVYTQFVNNIYALYIKQTYSTNISIQIQTSKYHTQALPILFNDCDG